MCIQQVEFNFNFIDFFCIVTLLIENEFYAAIFLMAIEFLQRILSVFCVGVAEKCWVYECSIF